VRHLHPERLGAVDHSEARDALRGDAVLARKARRRRLGGVGGARGPKGFGRDEPLERDDRTDRASPPATGTRRAL
jgi:hypothetical protein